MPDTTSELVHRLKSWESGRKLLNQEETVSTCSQVLLELLEKAGLSAPADPGRLAPYEVAPLLCRRFFLFQPGLP